MGRGDWPENVIVGEQRGLVEPKVEFIELYKIRSMFHRVAQVCAQSTNIIMLLLRLTSMKH